MKGPKNVHKTHGFGYLSEGLEGPLPNVLTLGKVAKLKLSDNFLSNGPGVRIFLSDGTLAAPYAAYHGTMWKEAMGDEGLELHLIEDVGVVEPHPEEDLISLRTNLIDEHCMDVSEVVIDSEEEPPLEQRIQEYNEEKQELANEVISLTEQVQELVELLNEEPDIQSESAEMLYPAPVNMGAGPQMAVHSSKRKINYR